MDMKVGLVCGLTGEKANFETECPTYEYDKSVAESKDNTEAIEPQEVIRTLSPQDLERFKSEQNFTKAAFTGIAVGIVGALLWGVITVITEYQIGLMAIAIGAAVGFSMRYTGNGIDQIFGITGGIISVLSCLLGNFLSVIGFIANAEGLGYVETLLLFDYSQLVSIMLETFSPMDILFYAFAAYEGYRFSFRSFTEKDLYKLDN